MHRKVPKPEDRFGQTRKPSASEKDKDEAPEASETEDWDALELIGSLWVL